MRDVERLVIECDQQIMEDCIITHLFVLGVDFQRRIFEAAETTVALLGEEREQVEQRAFSKYGQKMQDISATLERIGDCPLLLYTNASLFLFPSPGNLFMISCPVGRVVGDFRKVGGEPGELPRDHRKCVPICLSRGRLTRWYSPFTPPPSHSFSFFFFLLVLLFHFATTTRPSNKNK